MQTSTFTAPDIVCDGCAAAIRKALARVQGVAGIDVDVAEKRVTIAHEAAVQRAALAAALDRAGFPALE
ncbi:MAG TPA: heavy-metal-associated domain-containing protein [Chthonomonadaceae bacterium]|nr:heavy-metal-associated domain-containing protein [Chthonomonadaceae bacterium]